MARRSPRLTGRALCEVLDLGPKSVSRRLNGETSFDLDELHKVAAWLELPIEVLLHPAERAVTAA